MGAHGYGQFCPVAKAMELLDERWTMLVMRGLLTGSRHFADVQRGLPRISPTLLSQRLGRLTRAGVVERRNEGNRIVYVPTAAGEELRPIVEALGRWGRRWIPELGDEDLDPHLLMWDMHRYVDPTAVPGRRTVVRFTFTDVAGTARHWWLVIRCDRGEVDVCDEDPGFDVDVGVECELVTLTRVWRRDRSWSDAVRGGAIRLHGPEARRRELPRWFGLEAVVGSSASG